MTRSKKAKKKTDADAVADAAAALMAEKMKKPRAASAAPQKAPAQPSGAPVQSQPGVTQSSAITASKQEDWVEGMQRTLQGNLMAWVAQTQGLPVQPQAPFAGALAGSLTGAPQAVTSAAAWAQPVATTATVALGGAALPPVPGPWPHPVPSQATYASVVPAQPQLAAWPQPLGAAGAGAAVPPPIPPPKPPPGKPPAAPVAPPAPPAAPAPLQLAAQPVASPSDAFFARLKELLVANGGTLRKDLLFLAWKKWFNEKLKPTVYGASDVLTLLMAVRSHPACRLRTARLTRKATLQRNGLRRCPACLPRRTKLQHARLFHISHDRSVLTLSVPSQQAHCTRRCRCVFPSFFNPCPLALLPPSSVLARRYTLCTGLSFRQTPRDGARPHHLGCVKLQRNLPDDLAHVPRPKGLSASLRRRSVSNLVARLTSRHLCAIPLKRPPSAPRQLIGSNLCMTPRFHPGPVGDKVDGATIISRVEKLRKNMIYAYIRDGGEYPTPPAVIARLCSLLGVQYFEASCVAWEPPLALRSAASQGHPLSLSLQHVRLLWLRLTVIFVLACAQHLSARRNTVLARSPTSRTSASSSTDTRVPFPSCTPTPMPAASGRCGTASSSSSPP